MQPVTRLKQAWSLYLTDDRMDTLVAVALVLSVVYPAVAVWRAFRNGGDSSRTT